MGITLEAYYSDAPKCVKFFVFANKIPALGNDTRYSANMAKQGAKSTCGMHRGNVPQG